MRFRLLSYVSAILSLAVLLGVNLTPMAHTNQDLEIVFPADSRFANHFSPNWVDEYGWPIKAVAVSQYRTSYSVSDKYTQVSKTALALDIAIGLAIPIAGLFACEFVLRRYAKERSAKSR